MRTVPAGWMLAIAGALIILLTAARDWTMLLWLAVAVTFLLFWIKAPMRRLLSALKSSAPLFAIAGVLHLAFRFWFIETIPGSSWREHLLNTAFFLVRLLMFVLVPAALFALHGAAAYAEAAVQSIGRLTGWRLARQVGQISHLAFSMLPELRDYAAQRKLSRELRGIAVPSSLRGKLSFVRAEFFSVIQQALQLSNTIAIVLWSRGYQETSVRVAPILDEVSQPSAAPQH